MRGSPPVTVIPTVPATEQRPLRILGVGPGYSLIFLRWAWRLAELGHDVHIVSPRYRPDRPEELEMLTAHDLTTLELGTRIKGLRRVRFIPAIRRLAREIDAEIVHAHYLLPYGHWAAGANVHPLVMSPWNTDIFTYGKEQRRGRRWVAESIRAGDRFVVSSLGNEDETVRLGADRSHIDRIVWYVDLRPFDPAKRDHSALAAQFGWPDDSVIVLSLRNYRPNTNLDVVLRAFKRVAAEEPKARMILAARGGPEAKLVRGWIDDLGLADEVRMHFIAPDDLPVVCASSDIGVSVASTDATPASMIESMASRLPMVMGEAITIDEWITQGEGGEVVGCRDEDAITAALLKLIRDPGLRAAYGERNERVVRQRLPNHPGQELERVYRALLAQNGG
jgi:glycosyltransferase involved in cell wall biosynthesis